MVRRHHEAVNSRLASNHRPNPRSIHSLNRPKQSLPLVSRVAFDHVYCCATGARSTKEHLWRKPRQEKGQNLAHQNLAHQFPNASKTLTGLLRLVIPNASTTLTLTGCAGQTCTKGGFIECWPSHICRGWRLFAASKHQHRHAGLSWGVRYVWSHTGRRGVGRSTGMLQQDTRPLRIQLQMACARISMCVVSLQTQDMLQSLVSKQCDGDN